MANGEWQNEEGGIIMKVTGGLTTQRERLERCGQIQKKSDSPLLLSSPKRTNEQRELFFLHSTDEKQMKKTNTHNKT